MTEGPRELFDNYISWEAYRFPERGGHGPAHTEDEREVSLPGRNVKAREKRKDPPARGGQVCAGMRRGFFRLGLVGALFLTAGATWCGDTVIARRFRSEGYKRRGA